jgi:hypothetical protein
VVVSNVGRTGDINHGRSFVFDITQHRNLTGVNHYSSQAFLFNVFVINGNHQNGIGTRTQCNCSFNHLLEHIMANGTDKVSLGIDIHGDAINLNFNFL